MNFLYYMISSSVLILLILLIRALLRKRLSPTVVYALWLIPLIRLMVPFGTWEFSPFGISAELLNTSSAFVSELFAEEEAFTELAFPMETTAEVENSGNQVKIYDGVKPQGEKQDAESVNKEVLPDKLPNIVIGPKQILIVCWFVGSFLVGSYAFVQNRKFYKYTRSLPVINRFQGLPVCVSGSLKTSCLFGVIKPKIIVTETILEDETLYHFVLQHEYAHYKQKDYLWKALKIIGCIIYWWNPLIWIAAKCVDEDAELACDANVLKGQASEQRKAYGYALLKMIETAEYNRGDLCVATSVSGSKNSMKKRISEISNHTKTKKRVLLPIVLILIVLFILGCGVPSSKSWIKTADWAMGETDEVIFNEAEYTYSLQEEFQTSLIYSEIYEYGELVERNILAYGKIEELQNTIKLRDESYKYEQKNQFILEMDGIGISMEAPASKYRTDGRYAGNALHAEDDMIEVKPGDDLILMADYQAKGEETLQTFNCEILAAYTEEELQEILKENYVVSFIRLILSDKTPEELCKEMTEKEFPAAGVNANSQLFAATWADAFVSRDAKNLISLAAEEAKQQLIESSMMDESGVDFGWSSPWPMSPENNYRIIKCDSSGAEILYYAMDSTPHVAVWQETLGFEKVKEELKVSSWQIHWCDSISEIEDFRIAYPEKAVSGTPMDYNINGLGEALNRNALLSSSNMYLPLFDAGTAALELLNISKDYELVHYTTEDKGEETIVYLHFLNEDGTTDMTDVTMWQPYGENGIWIPK